MDSRTLDYICRSFAEKTRTERVGRFRAEPERGENPIREMPFIVRDDGLGLSRDGRCDDMGIAHVGQGNALQRFRIGIEVRAGECLLHLCPRECQPRNGVAELVAAASHPFRVNCFRPCRAECTSFGDPQQEVPYAASEEHARVENGGFHGEASALGSVTKVLRLGGECFERPATRRLIPLIGKQRAHRNAMMRADHATRENALLDEVQEIGA
jgi:hypothetical protein